MNRPSLPQGLAFMHANSKLHQSIGPGSVVIKHSEERELQSMQARLRDLAFAVDISGEALVGGATLGDIWDQGATSTTADPKCVLYKDSANLQAVYACMAVVAVKCFQSCQLIAVGDINIVGNRPHGGNQKALQYHAEAYITVASNT